MSITQFFPLFSGNFSFPVVTFFNGFFFFYLVPSIFLSHISSLELLSSVRLMCPLYISILLGKAGQEHY